MKTRLWSILLVLSLTILGVYTNSHVEAIEEEPLRVCRFGEPMKDGYMVMVEVYEGHTAVRTLTTSPFTTHIHASVKNNTLIDFSAQYGTEGIPRDVLESNGWLQGIMTTILPNGKGSMVFQSTWQTNPENLHAETLGVKIRGCNLTFIPAFFK